MESVKDRVRIHSRIALKPKILPLLLTCVIAMGTMFYMLGIATCAYAASEKSSVNSVAVVVKKQSNDDVNKVLARDKKKSNVKDEHKVVTTIPDQNVPLSTIDPFSGRWALMNLILTLLTGIFAVIVLINYIISRSSKLVPVLFGVLATIFAAIFFILSEDMGMPLQMTDEYTGLHSAFLVIAIASFLFQLWRPKAYLNN